MLVWVASSSGYSCDRCHTAADKLRGRQCAHRTGTNPVDASSYLPSSLLRHSVKSSISASHCLCFSICLCSLSILVIAALQFNPAVSPATVAAQPSAEPDPQPAQSQATAQCLSQQHSHYSVVSCCDRQVCDCRERRCISPLAGRCCTSHASTSGSSNRARGCSCSVGHF